MDVEIKLWVRGAPISDDIAERAPQAGAMGCDVVEFPLQERGGFDYEHTRDRFEA